MGIVLYQTPNYQLTSYSNGGAYTLLEKNSSASVFVQGDEATRFREELDALEATNMPLDLVLAMVFSFYNE